MSVSPNISDVKSSPRPHGSQFSVIVLILAVAAIAGYSYWKFVYFPSTPQYTLDKFFIAAKARDYDSLYNLVHVTGLLKAAVPNAKGLRDMAQRMPGLVPEVEEYRFGAATVSSDRATIETATTTRTLRGVTSNTLNVEMERVNGSWMIDGRWILREVGKRGLGGLIIDGSER